MDKNKKAFMFHKENTNNYVKVTRLKGLEENSTLYTVIPGVKRKNLKLTTKEDLKSKNPAKT